MAWPASGHRPEFTQPGQKKLKKSVVAIAAEKAAEAKAAASARPWQGGGRGGGKRAAASRLSAAAYSTASTRDTPIPTLLVRPSPPSPAAHGPRAKSPKPLPMARPAAPSPAALLDPIILDLGEPMVLSDGALEPAEGAETTQQGPPQSQQAAADTEEEEDEDEDSQQTQLVDEFSQQIAPPQPTAPPVIELRTATTFALPAVPSTGTHAVLRRRSILPGGTEGKPAIAGASNAGSKPGGRGPSGGGRGIGAVSAVDGSL